MKKIKGIGMDFKSLFTAFVTIFIAELGDKTQLATLIYSAKCDKPLSVFIGSSCALIATSAIAVLLGVGAAKAIPSPIITKIGGAIFIFIGFLMVIGRF